MIFYALLTFCFYQDSNLPKVVEQIPHFRDLVRIAANLTPEEQLLAQRLATNNLRKKGAFRGKKTFLSSTTGYRDINEETRGVFRRLAQVVFYRYRDRCTFYITVDLDGKKVVAKQKFSDHHPPYSQAEVDWAERLARTDPAVQKLLGPFSGLVETEARSITSPKGHRVLQVFFTLGTADFLENTWITVNLTSEKVDVQTLPQAEQRSQ